MTNILISWFFLLLLSGCGGPPEEMILGPKTPSPKRATSAPYVINGVYYAPQSHYELCETGISSYYGGPDGCHGTSTSMGKRFNMFALTAAHRTLPLPCVILVENLENQKSLKVKVNDRGPFINNRILDVSWKAAERLGFLEKGLAKVRITTLVDESLALPENAQYAKNKGIFPTALNQEKRVLASSAPFIPPCKTQPMTVTPPHVWQQCAELSQEIKQRAVLRVFLVISALSLNQANALQKTLQMYGKTALKKGAPQGDPYYIFIGPFASRTYAQGLKRKLASNYVVRMVAE
jgi:rare lipoprotein A (peptidoglycan hydrolase)